MALGCVRIPRSLAPAGSARKATRAASRKRGTRVGPSHCSERATPVHSQEEAPGPPSLAALNRRGALILVPAASASAAVRPSPLFSSVSLAEEVGASGTGSGVLVVGSTGNTGRLVVAELVARGDVRVVAGARDAEKAEGLGLGASGLGATVLGGVDVTKSGAELAAAMRGMRVVVVATGFVPKNPFKMGEAAHEVDNVGVTHVVDAAKLAGVGRVVLISSILTNGRAMGAADTAGFRITNAFGGVLDEKLQGEQYLRSSGVPYTIVRPAGLKNEAPANSLVVCGEDVMTSGEISRALVAKVMAAAAFDPACENRVLEIAEEGSFAGDAPSSGRTFALGSDPASWFT